MTGRKSTGKLAARKLARLLDRYGAVTDGSVLVGPGVGLDAAAVTVRGGALVLASDPVTYATEELGRYVVHVNANDIFVSGAEPCWFLASILLPPGQGGLAERILAQIHQACGELGVLLVGGHTEMTPGLPRAMVAGFMVGRAVGKRVLTAGGVQAGDAIVLTKGVAIEGTAIIARQFERQLLKRLPRALVRRGKRFLDSPGIGVGPEARIALRHRVHAMHDPTEGGLLNGLWEMSWASGLALHLRPDRVPVYPETEAICRCFDIDPLRLLASGALLLSCPKGAARGLLKALASEGIPASEIGSACGGPRGVYFEDGRSVKEATADEILKTFPAPLSQEPPLA